MKNALLILIGFALLSGTAFSQKKPHPSMVKVEDVPGLPRVLLIGDSISMGYTVPVQKLLKGKANVHRISANGGPTSRGLANIERWLGDDSVKWDVIHFNWGIHDLKIMPTGKLQVEPADYEKNLRELVARLQKTGAKLIWATITPIPDETLIQDRNFGDESEYNKVAAKIMAEAGGGKIVTNNLNTFVTPRFTELQEKGDLHFKPEGSEFLATKVAAEIEKVLAK